MYIYNMKMYCSCGCGISIEELTPEYYSYIDECEICLRKFHIDCLWIGWRRIRKGIIDANFCSTCFFEEVKENFDMRKHLDFCKSLNLMNNGSEGEEKDCCRLWREGNEGIQCTVNNLKKLRIFC